MQITEVKPTKEVKVPASPVASEPPRKDACCDDDEDHNPTGKSIVASESPKTVPDETVEAIVKSDEPADDGVPAIVKTLVYYGLGEGKKPDPNKILYYERPDGSCIDVGAGGAIIPRPAVCDHLPSRGVTTEDRDILSAIVNGAMDDNDYNTLNENGIISDLGKRMWEKFQLLKSQQEQLALAKSLAKSEDSEDSGEDKKDTESEEHDSETDPSVGEAYTEESPDDETDGLRQAKEELGDDVFQEIMDLAMAKCLGSAGALEGLEGKIRSIVYEVLEEMMGEPEETDQPEQEQVETISDEA